ncbi:MAG: Spy/CpxP family protein refolding chaperone [Bacteroidia bacterium]
MRKIKKVYLRLNLGSVIGVLPKQTLKKTGMKKMMATIGVAALLVGSSFAQNAQTAPAKKTEFRKEKRKDMMADIPNLTEDQTARIKKIKGEARKKAEPQRKEMKDLRSKLGTLKMAEKPDMKQINSLIDQLAKMKAEMEKSRTVYELEVRRILTPEQRKVVDAQRNEKMEIRDKKYIERKEINQAK